MTHHFSPKATHFLPARIIAPLVVMLGLLAGSASAQTLVVGPNGVTTNITSRTNFYSEIVIGNTNTSRNTLNILNRGTVVTGTGTLADLYVGRAGSSNNLVVSNGAYLGANDTLAGSKFGLFVGTNSANNRVLVTGSNSYANLGRIFVGSGSATTGSMRGSNSLIISNGGYVEGNQDLVVDSGYETNVLVTGRDSTLRSGGAANIGVSTSFNFVLITNGGYMRSCGAFVGINSRSFSNSVLVTGTNSLWEPGDLTLGVTGADNRLTISNGGFVDDDYTMLGSKSGGRRNSILVTGAGSKLKNYGMYIGYDGDDNSMTISNGGYVESANTSYIGQRSASNSVLVTGRGSVWDLDELQIGPWQDAGGTLTIASGGTVNASRILLASYTRSVATVNFGTPGGSDTNMVFSAPIVFGASPGLLNFNQADTYTFSTPISGPGSVAQRGSGTTIFTADHTYRGTTPIERGTLRLNGTHRGGAAYTVSSGATFGGTGLTDSAVTVQSGGTIRPGNGTAPGVLTVGSLTLNAGGTLNILLGGAISSLLDVNGSVSLSGLVSFTTTAALTADLYPFLSYSNTFAGSFSSNGVPTGYNLFHNTNDKILFLAKPTPVNALETAPLYEQGNEIITGGSNTFGVFVYNASSNTSATFNVTSGSNTAGSISSRTLAALRGTNAGPLTFTGTNVGTNTGRYTVNNTNGSSTNGSVQFLVYDHAKGNLATNRVSLGEAIVGYTNPLGGFLAVSNTNGFRVALATRSTNSGWTNLRITDVTGVLAGASDNLGLSLQGQGTGTFSSNVAVTFADSSTLNGASTNVGTTNFTVTATVYDHAAGRFSAQTVDLGEAIVGFTNSLTGSVGVSNAAGFRVALRSSSSSTNGNLSVGDLTSLAAGSATNLAVGLRNQGVGVFSNNVAVTFADSSSLNGFSTNLGTTNFSATGKIYDHASGRIVGSSGVSFAPVHVGYTNQLAGDGSLTLSNTAGFLVALKTANSTTNARLGLGTVSNLANGSSTNLLATLAVGQGVGRFTNMVTVTFADDSTLNGASTNVGSTNISMSGYVYSGQGVWLGGSGDWTDFDNWQVPGGTPGLDGALSVNDTATFGTGGGGTASLQTNASLLSVIFNSPTSYNVAGDGILSLANSGGTSASISTLAGRHAIATALRLAGGNVGLNGSAGTELVLEGPVNGSGGLTQQGAGTTTVTGANTYTGSTTITNGTFVLNGTHTGGGAYTVANRGTLGGVGRTASAATVNSGGTISPGNGTAPGILTVGGLTLNSGGTLNILLGGAASSLLDVEGNVTLAGAVSFSTNSSLTASLYPFLNYTGTLSGVFAQTNALPEGFQLVYGSSQSVFLIKTNESYPVGALFDGTNAVITGGQLPFEVEVYNNGTNSVTFTAAGDTNTTGNAGPTTVNPTNSGNAAGLTWNGTNVGTNTGSFTATFSNGVNPVTTNSVPVTVLVYDHAKGSLGTNTIALGDAIVGYTGPLTGSLAVSNTNGFRVALATASSSTNPNLDITDVTGVLPGSAEDITVGLSGQGAGVFTNDVTVIYADSSTLAGASTNLGTANFTVTGTIYDHASGSFVGGTNINLGLVRVGYTAPVTGTNSLVVTNQDGLRVAVGSINNYDTDDLSLATVSGLAEGNSTNLSATLGVGRAAGLYTNLVNVTFFDDSTLNGASANVGTATVSVTSYIYTGQGVWLGGSGDWTTLTNWQVPGGIPGLDGALSVNDTATFDTNGTGGTANLTNDAVLRSITFSNTASYTIAGSGSITLAAASGGPATIANLAGSHTIYNAINAGSTLQVTGASGTELTLAGLISGDEGLTKSGEGTLKLAAVGNAYRGETLIEDGSLQTGVNGTMSTNSLVRVRGGTFDLNGTTNTVAGLILHNTTITQDAGVLTTLKPGAPDDSLKIAGEVGDVAQYDLSGGSINVMGSLQVGYFGNGTFNQTGGTNTVLSDFVFVVGRHVGANGVYNLTGGEANHSGAAGYTLIGEDGTGVMNVGGTGVFNAAASMYIGYTATADGTLNINDGGTVNTPGIVFGAGTGRLNFDRADAYTFSAPISGGTAGRTSVTKNGTGTVVLSASNSYSGGTFINSGLVATANAHAFGTSDVTINQAGTLAPGLGESLVIGGDFTVNSGTYQWTLYDNTTNGPGTNFTAPVKLAGALQVAEDSPFAMFFTNVTSSDPFWTTVDARQTWRVMESVGNSHSLVDGFSFKIAWASVDGNQTNGLDLADFFFTLDEANGYLDLNYLKTARDLVATNVATGGTTIASGTNSYATLTYETNGLLLVDTLAELIITDPVTMSNNSTTTINGSFVAPGGVAVQSGSTIGGSGTIDAEIVNSGTFAPAVTNRSLTINNDLTFKSGSAFLWTLYDNTTNGPGINFTAPVQLNAKMTVETNSLFTMLFTNNVSSTNSFWKEETTNSWTVMTGESIDLQEGTMFKPDWAPGSQTNGFKLKNFYFTVTDDSLVLNFMPGLIVFPGEDEFDPGVNEYPWMQYQPGGELDIPVGVDLVIENAVVMNNNSTTIVNGQFTSLANSFTVMGGSSVGGNGTINGNLVNNGLVSPGNSPGTLSIGGNFTQTAAGTFLLEAASLSNFDRLNATGAATVGGTLQAVGFGGHNLSPGDSYQFLTADGGISGTFDTISVPAGLRGSFLISGVNNSLGTLLIAPSTYTSMALTPNQFNVAAALDNFIGAGGDRGVVSAALDTLTAAQYPAAFEQTLPNAYASLPNMAFNTANALNSGMFQRLWVIRINGKGFSAGGMNLAPMQAEMGGTDDMGAFAINPAKDTKWGTFVDGNGIFANGGNVNYLQNYRSQSGGVSTGASYAWNDNLSTGVYVGYQGLQAEYDNGRTIDNAVRFGVFGTYDIDHFYVNALVGGAYHGYTVNRNIDFGGLNRTATGRPGAGEFDLALGTGYDFDIGDFSWGPFTTMQYTYLGVQGFTETGAGALNLDVDPYNSSSLLYTLGAQAAYNWKISKDVIVTPTIFAGWQHEFLQDSYQINSSFNTGGPAAPFNYNTGTPARDNFYGGVGITVGIGDAWQATATYSSFVGGQNQNSQNLYLGLGYKF